MTPDQIAAIRRMASDGDPFYKGAAWILDQLQPPPNTGASSCPTRRKDTP